MNTGKLIVVAALALGVWGGSAAGVPQSGGLVLAQQGALPPRPGKADDPPVVITYALLLFLVAGIIGANLIPTKRGHQD